MRDPNRKRALSRCLGAVGEIHLWKFMMTGPGNTLSKIQPKKEILDFFGNELPSRVYDALGEINGTKKYIDSKAWKPSAIEKEVKRSLTWTPKEKGGKIVAGQLYRDVVRIYNNGNWHPDVGWAFDARAEGMEAKIVDWIVEGVKRESVLIKLEKNLGIDNLAKNKEAQRKFINRLRNNLNDFVVIVP